MLGNSTITVESANHSRNQSYQSGGVDAAMRGVQVSENEGRSYSVMARELMKPDEVLQMSGDCLIAFLKNCPPLWCKRIVWYRDRAFGGGSSNGKSTIPAPLLAVLIGCAVLGAMYLLDMLK
jgi:type IV secretory pathway TraG/TraD family ATPase VirD4